MNKGDFISYVADKNNWTKAKATETVDAFVNSVTSALGEGEEVAIMGFGKFSVKDYPATMGNDPRTGKKIPVKAYKQPKFKVGKNLKDACN